MQARTKQIFKRSLLSLSVIFGFIAVDRLMIAPAFTPWPVEELTAPSEPDRGPGEHAEQDEQGLSLAAVEAMPAASWHLVDTRQLTYLPRGKTKHVWLRMRVPPNPDGSQLVAEVRTTLLRVVDFFVVEKGRVVATSAQGMDRPFANRSFRYFYQSMTFAKSKTLERELYVHVASPLIVAVPLAVRDLASFQGVMIFRIAALALFIGIFFGIVLYNVIICLSLGDRVSIYYLIYHLCVFTFGIFFSGIFQILFPFLATQFDASFRICVTGFMLVCIWVILFNSELMALRHNDPKTARLVWPSTIFMSCVMLPICWFAPLWLAVDTILLWAAAGAVFIWAVNLIRRTTLTALYFNLAFAGLCVCHSLHISAYFGVIKTSMITEYLTCIGGIWEALLMSLAMSHRINAMRAERAKILDALSGEAPATILNSLLSDNYRKSVSQAELNVSIMFVDIVGFSQIADLVGSVRVFQLLSRLMSEIGAIVKEHGGAVDRSLGDGVLCFFGYEDASAKTHPQDAFQAACKVQHRIAALASEVTADYDVIMPVRIGLHMATVLIGDLGSGNRVDFTMIGSGVTFANRLETVCSPFKLMLSRELHLKLPPALTLKPGFSAIQVALKQQDELISAFEFNPFAQDPEVLSRVEGAYRQQMRIASRSSRFEVQDRSALALTSELGELTVLDFSADGFRLVAAAMVGQKSWLLVRLRCRDPAVTLVLAEALLSSIYIEVRWSRSLGDSYEHGVKIVGLSEEQKLFLFQTLSAMFSPEEVAQYSADERLAG